MREIDPLISNFSHLKDKSRGTEALKSLQKIASLVKPLMRQRGWRVGTLTEFYPQQKNLLGLNWNRGQEICLRLRYPGDDNQFMPLEHVVDTMLHELSHIVHDAHDAKFNALWQQLREEHENLTRKGYTGEGFLSTGKKLGGKRMPMNEARRQARSAAEKRRTLQSGSGQRLGGMPVRRGADMRQIIADAVQRRLTVTKGCASNTKDSRAIFDQATQNGFRTQAEEDDANERAIMQAYIELLQEEEKVKWGDAYVPPSQENPAGNAKDHEDSSTDSEEDDDEKPSNSESLRGPPQGSKSALPSSKATIPRSVTSERKPHPNSISSSSSARSSIKKSAPPHEVESRSQPGSWTCSICTLQNPLNFLCCDACMTERPSNFNSDLIELSDDDRPLHQSSSTTRPPPPRPVASTSTPRADSWICHRCGTYMEAQWWTCSCCGTMKLSS